MAIHYLDGQRFRRAVVAGADWVRHTREQIDRINVYPVPDGDTGTNMALSLAATAATLRASQGRDLAQTGHLAAEASVLGAKGNSGLILAHWFLGLAKGFRDRPRIAGSDLAAALGEATQAVYDALEKPVEGTILTVMRAVSDHARASCLHGCDLGRLVEHMVGSGKKALAGTTQQLAALREAHVVDAGALGYVNFLQGVLRAIRGETVPDFDAASSSVTLGPDHGPHAAEEQVAERFCTELVVRGKGFQEAKLKRRFAGLGGSLLIATTDRLFKLHIHTNHPDEVMRLATRLGVIQERKVDDMLRQSVERHGAPPQPLIPLAEQPGTVAIICDSTADLPLAIREQMGIEMAPLQIMFGDEVFRDQVDLSTEEFYGRLQRDPRHPTTSQPPPREFVAALDRIRTDREVVILTLSGLLSGTHKAALSAARLADHPRVEVVDTGSASTGHGMITLNAARLAQRGASVDDILYWVARWQADTGLVFSLATLDYLKRGGRIGAAKSLIGKFLGMQPILGFVDGNVVPLALARGQKDAFAKVTGHLEQALPPGSRVRVGLIEIGETEALDGLQQWLGERCEVVETTRGSPTGVIGAHAGPGGWGLFYQKVRDDDPLLA